LTDFVSSGAILKGLTMKEKANEVVALRAQDKNNGVVSPLLKCSDAAAYIGMSVSWLKQNPDMIPYVRIGEKSKRWRIADLDAFIARSVKTAN
jgi:predicted DNA-binding transcriptional regulator AlpA